MNSAGVLSRRYFLRGRLRPFLAIVRPPRSTDDSVLQSCERCGKCAEICPEGIISLGGDGCPEVHFVRGECTFCGACADICPAPVFKEQTTTAWQLRLAIADG